MTNLAGPDDFGLWLQSLAEVFIGLPDDKRNAVLDTLIDSSGPSQLLVLSSRIPQLVFRDFITGLPPELGLLILHHLSGKQLVICCMVCKAWNKLISSMSGLWRPLAVEAGANVSIYEERMIKEGGLRVKSELGLVKSLSPILAQLHKSLYLQATATLRGLDTGKALNIRKDFIDKGQWRITSVKYHNGNIVTGCDDHKVQVWSVPDGAALHSVSTHSVCCLAVRGTTLYTASFNANAESWDLVSGRHSRTFCGHTSAVLAVDVTWDQAFMLTGSVDRTAKVWDLRPANAVLVRTINSIHEDWVFQVKFLPGEPEVLNFLTCDSNLCNLWKMSHTGDVISSHHINSDGSSKFTSFYLLPEDPYQMFACQWEEWSKSSWLTKYTIRQSKFFVEKDYHVLIPVETIRAYILGAGRKFAVIMCSISRKDFHVIDLSTKVVVAKITTPDFCMLTRNGSTVALCDTAWLDGFVFEDMSQDLPVFTASIGQNTVMLATWTCHDGDRKKVCYDSEV